MKKIMLSLLCAGIAASASAQKNSILLFGGIGGGTASSSVGSGPSTSTSTFHFMPGVGYQVNNNWTFGVEAIFDYTNGSPVPTPTPTTVSTTNVGGGLFARYSHPLAGIFSWYLQGDVTYTAGSTSGGGADRSTMGVSIMPEISANLKNGFAINFGFGHLGFNYTTTSTTPEFHNTMVDYNFFQGVNFGMSKNFAKKAKPAKKHSDVEGSDAE